MFKQYNQHIDTTWLTTIRDYFTTTHHFMGENFNFNNTFNIIPYAEAYDIADIWIKYPTNPLFFDATGFFSFYIRSTNIYCVNIFFDVKHNFGEPVLIYYTPATINHLQEIELTNRPADYYNMPNYSKRILDTINHLNGFLEMTT